jgi:DNA-binding NtrC family response regulator
MPTVLLLEDEEMIRSIVALGLERQFRVLEAGDVWAAIALSKSYRIDVLVADAQAVCLHPDVDFLGEFQAHSPNVKVLLTSGHDRLQVSRSYNGLTAGSQFLQKPFSLGLLGQTVELMIRPALPPVESR